MGWDRDLFAILDDWEGRAQAEFALERGAEIRDRGQAEYAEVTLAGRLMASRGRQVSLEVDGVGGLHGALVRSAADWLLLEASGSEWLVPHRSLLAIEGASARSLPEAAWSPLSRLSLTSALRRLADAGPPCLLYRRDGGRLEARPRRVGRDFVEVEVEREEARARARILLVPYAGIAAVRSLAA